MIAIGIVSLAIWLVLVFARHGFWRTRERDTRDLPPLPAHWPAVTAIVPARDEAEVIAESIGSLLAQDYPGEFRVILVDDSSSDGTAEIARRSSGAGRLEILSGQPLPRGWTGKLWAVSQGVEQAGETPEHLWLTDADIAHAPDTLATLVARGEAGDLALVSLMAKLRCTSFAERALIPAFVFFFQLLYPFARVNRPGGIGAAAGGCMLVRREALAAAGGIAAIRGALIDDCAMGAALKRQGPIWLGLTNRSRSIRAYDTADTIAAMISRSAYAQLGYSPLLLVGTLVGLALVYAAPPALTFFGHGWTQACGLAAWALMALAFQPMLRFYHRSALWGVALPGIAAFYAGCTLLSAWQYYRGRGGTWKGRTQANA
ncbi:glycosyl transferase family 2 [Sphingomonas sp. Leaf357]|uniref:glycosyltransferase n=1 Tax=Sphingomonas sp. Leaf357 TaxID=1736350 RepID=UPI0007007479|nr:glycosyltransferase [Sphingomonas sp. Leaf357]KQS01313.1 glycosyl transferase family 2 [Sphingomonas sp. Leaf357]